MTALATSTDSPATVAADAVVVGVAQNEDGPVLLGGTAEVDEAFGGRLAAVLATLGATGAAGEVTRVAALGATAAPTVVAVGVGRRDERHTPEALRRAAGAATRALAGTPHVATTLAEVNGASPGTTDATIAIDLAAVAEGALLGAYRYSDYRAASHTTSKRPVATVTLLGVPEGTAAAALSRARVIAEAVALARDLVNTPPRDLPPAVLANRAVALAAEHGLDVEVLDEQALAEGGYGGITGVGQGSTRPPRLVRLHHRGRDRAGTDLALVGKGITFDSGGLSLKPAASMETMKSDMAGAAATLATLVAAARLGIAASVTGWLPLAENMPSGAAIRPSDVLTLRGGKTVEVLNTDAEGRLVLADAIVRAGEESPGMVVDVATLTGAQVVALGTRVGAVMGTDGAREQVVAAAERSGESFWPMPLPPELRPSIDSEIADLQNIGERSGGMLVAGLFLKEFVPADTPWAHLDIAGPAFNGGSPHGYTPKGGTGVAVRTLLSLLEELEAAGD